jgi:hypothetical protein
MAGGLTVLSPLAHIEFNLTDFPFTLPLYLLHPLFLESIREICMRAILALGRESKSRAEKTVIDQVI